MAVLRWGSDRDEPERGISADASFEELLGRHGQALAGYCRSLVRDEHDARDVLQNVSVRALLAFRRGDRPAHERAWLYRIAHNEAVTMFRARRQAQPLDETVVDPAAEPSRIALSREQLRELGRDLRALSPQARQIVMMTAVGKLDRRAVAAELGLSPGAVSQSLLESRAALRTDAAARELPCDAVRTILDGADGRRRRTRTVRAHLRGCSACREWDRRRARRTRIAAFLPAPLGTLSRWIQPVAAGDPATAVLLARPSSTGACRALTVVVSLAAGAAGITAGVPHPRPAPVRPAARVRVYARPANASRTTTVRVARAPRVLISRISGGGERSASRAVSSATSAASVSSARGVAPRPASRPHRVGGAPHPTAAPGPPGPPGNGSTSSTASSPGWRVGSSGSAQPSFGYGKRDQMYAGSAMAHPGGVTGAGGSGGS